MYNDERKWQINICKQKVKVYYYYYLFLTREFGENVSPALLKCISVDKSLKEKKENGSVTTPPMKYCRTLVVICNIFEFAEKKYNREGAIRDNDNLKLAFNMHYDCEIIDVNQPGTKRTIKMICVVR